MKLSKRFNGPALAACVVLALAVDLPASATGGVQLAEVSGGKLAGTWKGRYRYDDKRLPAKAFSATIVGGKGPAFEGRIEEPRYTRLGLSGRLSASLAGTLGKDGKVAFVKRYLGAAGMSRPVRYQGTLGAAGKTIKGTWRIPEEKLKGTFEMTRTGR
jgi:hypothetical protein